MQQQQQLTSLLLLLTVEIYQFYQNTV